MKNDIEIELGRFWALVLDVWRDGIYGMDIGKIILAFGIFLIFFSIRVLLTRFIIARIKNLASKTKTTLDDILVDAITPPIRFAPLVLGFFLATSILNLNESVSQFTSNMSKSLITYTIFWALYRGARPIGDAVERSANFLTHEMALWLSKFLQFSVALIGGAAILEIWGIAVGPLIAGLGLFGVAVALGAQDLFKNIIAGLFIIGEKRFHIKDWIQVEGIVEGDVEHIGFRTTTVRRFDKSPVYVPNSYLADNAVTNFSRMTFRRIRWTIGVRYDSKANQLKQVRDNIEAYLTEDNRYVKPTEAATFVRIDSFGASSIDISLYCFTRTTNWLAWMEVKEDLVLKVKEIVEEAGTDFAFPSRSLYIEQQDQTSQNQNNQPKFK